MEGERKKDKEIEKENKRKKQSKNGIKTSKKDRTETGLGCIKISFTLIRCLFE